MVTAHFSTRKRDGVPSTRFDQLNAAIGHSGGQTLRHRTRGRRPKGSVQVPEKARWLLLSRLKNAWPRTLSRASLSNVAAILAESAGFTGRSDWCGPILKATLSLCSSVRLDMNWSFEVGLSRAGDTRYSDPSHTAPLSRRQAKS